MTPVGTSRLRLGLAALLAAACAAPLTAQVVEGRVVRASDSAGVASALVRLLDPLGQRVAQTSTWSDGAFSLTVPAPGPYAIAVLRIGQRPWRSPVLDLESGAVRRLTLAVPDEPIRLAAIPIETRSRCRTSPAEGSVVAQLLEEADKALTVTRLAMERHEGEYVVRLYQRLLYREAQTRLLRTADSVGILAGGQTWPIRSLPPDSLAVHGFVREDTDSGPVRYTYFAPDATVLLSQWFIASHCFGVREGSGADTGTIIVTFRPEGGGMADIEGQIVFAQQTLELRRLEWRYVRQPYWVDQEGAAGEMVLDRLPSGVYLPSRWWMRAPVSGVNRRRQPTRVWGWMERGGHLAPGP